jgi:hypothetical protein
VKAHTKKLSFRRNFHARLRIHQGKNVAQTSYLPAGWKPALRHFRGHPFHVEHSACKKKDSSENNFCSRPSGSGPEGTTTKLIFMTMGAQTDMNIPPE